MASDQHHGSATDTADRVGAREKRDWANDCNDLRILVKSAEAAVRREEYEKAHEKQAEMAKLLERIREEYPRYIHEGGDRDE